MISGFFLPDRKLASSPFLCHCREFKVILACWRADDRGRQRRQPGGLVGKLLTVAMRGSFIPCLVGGQCVAQNALPTGPAGRRTRGRRPCRKCSGSRGILRSLDPSKTYSTDYCLKWVHADSRGFSIFHGMRVSGEKTASAQIVNSAPKTERASRWSTPDALANTRPKDEVTQPPMPDECSALHCRLGLAEP